MNHLKYIFNANVSRRVSSNTSLVPRRVHQSEICFKKRHSTTRIPKADRSNSFTTRGDHGIERKAGKICVQPRTASKLNVISTKNSPTDRRVENVRPGRRYSNTSHVVRFSSISHPARSNDGNNGKNKGVKNEPKDLRSDRCEENEVTTRSYAQMITDYSSVASTETSSLLKDGLASSTINKIYRSSFSTLTSDKNDSKKLQKKNSSLFDKSSNKINSDISSDTNEKEIRSYAKMIADYSDVTEIGAGSGLLNDCLSTKYGVLPKNPLGSFSTSNCKSGDSKETSNSGTNEKTQIDWLKKVENVIKDLRNATARRNMNTGKNPVKRGENDILQSVTEHANWLDRVVKAHKRGEKEVTKPTLTSTENKTEECDKYDVQNRDSSCNLGSVKGGKNFNQFWSSNTSQIKQKSKHSATVTKKDSLQSKGTNFSKEPRVQLRLVPTNTESMVSINVDPISKATNPGNTDAKELSVVVQSNKNSKASTSQWNVSTSEQNKNTSISDFGAMHISINEITTPVKQVEFSINGKPVSEVKSFIARSEKLDVVSSLDKIEIRIPYAKDDAQGDKDVKPVKPVPVLNLQISAKFEESPKETSKVEPKTETTQSPVTQSPKTHYVFKDKDSGSKMQSSRRTEHLQSESIDKLINIKKTENLEETNMDDRTVKSSLFNNSIKTEPLDERIPSNAVPWWSSDDCFSKIRKKTNYRDFFVSTSGKEATMKRHEIKDSQKSQSVGTVNNFDTISALNKLENKKLGKISTKDTSKITYSKVEVDLDQLRVSKLKTKQRYSAVSKVIRNKLEKPGDQALETKEDDIFTDARKAEATSLTDKVGDTIKETKRTILKETANPVLITSREKEMKTDKTKVTQSSTKIESSAQIKSSSNVQDLTSNTSKPVSQKESSRSARLTNEASTRIKMNIIDSMRPIEKKKDGTLIDYGVTVSSRKKPDRLRSTMKTVVSTSLLNNRKIQKEVKVTPEKSEKTRKVKGHKIDAKNSMDVDDKVLRNLVEKFTSKKPPLPTMTNDQKKNDIVNTTVSGKDDRIYSSPNLTASTEKKSAVDSMKPTQFPKPSKSTENIKSTNSPNTKNSSALLVDKRTTKDSPPRKIQSKNFEKEKELMSGMNLKNTNKGDPSGSNGSSKVPSGPTGGKSSNSGSNSNLKFKAILHDNSPPFTLSPLLYETPHKTFTGIRFTGTSKSVEPNEKRPEKDLLYTVWLQRYEKNTDGKRTV